MGRQTQTDGLRWTVKARTRSAHDALDAAFGQLTLSERTDYTAFLRAHGAALMRLSPYLDAPVIAARIDAIDRDLSRLGASLPLVHPPETLSGERAEKLGLAYVVAGSHLGQKVLRRQWAEARDADVAAAHAYFDLPDARSHWMDVLNAMDEMPSTGPEADKVVKGADMAFAIFAQAFEDFARGRQHG